MRKSKIICIDIETTGLDRNHDEILQISIINGRGKVLYNSCIKPDHLTEWKEAEEINKILWECVKDAPWIQRERKKIDKILKRAGLIIGYNHKGFDMPFLAAKGINTAVKAKLYDVMLEFAYIYGEETPRGYKWQRLTTCAAYYNYTDYKAHDALEDARATLYCYYAMQKDSRGRRMARKRKRRRMNKRQAKKAYKKKYGVNPNQVAKEINDFDFEGFIKAVNNAAARMTAALEEWSRLIRQAAERLNINYAEGAETLRKRGIAESESNINNDI